MTVPAYATTTSGRVYRLLRSSTMIAPDRIRYVLRAQPVNATDTTKDVEVSRELDAELILDKLAHNQAIPTPELTFEALWSQLRMDLDARESG